MLEAARGFLCAPCVYAVDFCVAWLKRVSSRLVEFKQDLESDHVRPKPYFEFLDAKRKIFRW